MTKFFTTLAALAFATTAFAQMPQDPDFTFTADPAQGEVTSLKTVTLTFPNLDEVELPFGLMDDEITVTCDGDDVRGVNFSTEENQFIFTFTTEQTAPGEYEFTIGDGALVGYAYDEEFECEEIVLTYTIPESGTTGNFDWTAEVDPEEGTVDQLKTINLTYTEIYDMEINAKDDVVLAYNGNPVTGLSFRLKNGYDGNEIVASVPTALTAPGTYTLTIPAGALTAYDEDYYYEDNLEDLVYEWTIEGTVSPVEFNYTSSLPTNEYLAYFGELTLTFDKLTAVSCADNGVTVKFNDAVKAATVTTDANKLKITLAEALNMVDGKVEVAIAAEALTGEAEGSTGTNAAPITLTYNMASPVEYDLTLSISTPKPNADNQISANKSLESFFFECKDIKGLVAGTGTENNVTIKEDNGSFEATGRLRKGSGLNSSSSYFVVAFNKEPSYNGTYTITIDKGAFGTESWLADPNYGRSNDEITLTFELVDGADRVKYTIEPVEITPESGIYASGADFATVTLKFDEGISAVEGASATLAGVDNSYSQTAVFTAVEGGYAVTFATAPTEDGQYKLSVLQGVFGDAGFVADGTGKANAPIEIEYSIDHNTGIQVVGVDENTVIYNLQGVRVNNSADRLPAGIYIVNGKKVMLNK